MSCSIQIRVGENSCRIHPGELPPLLVNRTGDEEVSALVTSTVK
jgi:hypothetical protein